MKYIRATIRLAFLFCSIVFAYSVYSQDTVHPVVMGYPYVHDGDTIRIGQYWIRLFGIDAEELDEPNGIRARDELMKIIGTSSVTCTLYEMSYRRHVGTCVTHTGKDIGLELIKSGWALDCPAYSGGRYAHLSPANSALAQKPYCKERSNEGTGFKKVYRHA